MVLSDWIGMILLLFCGFFLGVGLTAYLRRQFRQAEGFLTLLRTLRLEIDCFSLPVGKILAHCDGQLLADCGADSLPPDFESLLAGAKLYLPEEVCRLLYDFSGELGGGYRAEQLRVLDYYLSRLTPYCDKLRSELPRREKTAFLLPVALSAILALTLI